MVHLCHGADRKTSYEVKELDENDGYTLGCLKLELCGPENKLRLSTDTFMETSINTVIKLQIGFHQREQFKYYVKLFFFSF